MHPFTASLGHPGNIQGHHPSVQDNYPYYMGQSPELVILLKGADPHLEPTNQDQDPCTDSCEGRCSEFFNATRKCQCDDLCLYYQSCCSDYQKVCSKDTRGDVFAVPEDEYEPTKDAVTSVKSFEAATPIPTLEEMKTEFSTLEPTEEPTEQTMTEATVTTEDPVTEDIPEELCSGKAFDAFTNLKNGSVYAFRGKYFYELDDKKALDGYPKLIKDIWGIEGPIDAAFTRMNCQGKTYIFKGTQYWRFSDGTLEPNYPRDIDIGFSNIPNNIDAAFSLPANNYQGKERAYFFKGTKYWQYEFSHQPTREDCVGTAPSEVFTRYAVMQDDSWEDLFDLLFGQLFKDDNSESRSIFRDWRGIPNGVDAVLPSRIYISQQKRSSMRKSKRRKSSRRKSRKRIPDWTESIHFDIFEDVLNDDDDEEDDPDWLPIERPSKCQPVQNVYFFKKDKYYRVNMNTKRVDITFPRYPRSIAEYWLGCKKSKIKKSRG